MLLAAFRYISHQLVMSAWRRKPVVLFTILAVTILVLFVQYSQVGGETKNLSNPARKYQEPVLPQLHHDSRNNQNLVTGQHVTYSHQNPESYGIQQQQKQLHSHQLKPQNDEEHHAANKGFGDMVPVEKSIAIAVPSQPLPEPHTAPRRAPLHRIVHFDLKGAPPTIDYIRKVLPLIKEAGATGIMLEYEDMFPYTGLLEPVRANNAYQLKELDELLSYITVDLKLHLIPLIQTFGHMEYILKLPKFRHLREVDEFPAVICPSKNESFQLIKEMARQVMAVHSKYHVRYLHLGCDEVFHIGECQQCQSKNKDELLLGHMAQIGGFVRNELKVIPLVWDDMMRHFSAEQMKRYRLHEYVEPMVWTYVKDVYRFIPYSNWITFGETFPYIWAASAFKGAFGETLTVPNAKNHMENNIAWVDVIQEQREKFKLFRGLVITGWQRYDHFATLAETLPAGFPSLVLNLLVVTSGGFAGKESLIGQQMSKVLGCHEPLRRLDLDTDEFLYMTLSRCFFPGAAVYRMTENHRDVIKRANEYYDGVTLGKAWLTSYNVRRNYTFIDRIDQGLEEYNAVYYSLTTLLSQARDALREVFDEYTVSEWIEQNIYPTILKMEKLKADADSMRRARVWPKRPLPLNPDLQRFNVGRLEL